MIKRYRDFLSVGLLALLIGLSGCGGSTHSTVNDVTVSVTPASATVAASGQVKLTAVMSGCGSSCPAPAFTWSIVELQTNGASGSQCNWETTPPPGPCPDGTLEVTSDFTTATFHAPSSSGTIHVVAQLTGLGNPPTTKTGTATITIP
ncbi:hypothetical protein [Candidatus Korobacter versatilis]|uniref:hypothetical protein n=1 Tax=Candidatus Korobacter versatilis TaxID=658062 RepID=UPI0011D1548F|nr:hypothetical protein [Candidatus Koribacter versatilis]